MSGNSFKESVEQPEEVVAEQPATAEKKGGNRFTQTLTSLIDGSFLKQENAAKHITFFLFLSLMVIVYIGNGYYAEKTLRESNRITNELKQMQGQFINVQSKLSEKTRQSAIAKSAAALGLKEAVIPPAKLTIQVEKK